MSGNNNGGSGPPQNNQNMGPGGGGPSYIPKGPNDFRKGDMVWAKVRGYSWWPAKIGDI
jgi:PWWP domain